MKKIKYITGRAKILIDLKIQIAAFLYFSFSVLTGEIKLRQFPAFLRRLLYFLSKMKDNKYVSILGKVKINLYVPAFPSRAFFHACRKVIDNKVQMPAVTALISITSGCRCNCEHCYQKFDIGKDVNIDLLCDAAKKLQDMGCAFFNIEGGEPFLVIERLKTFCKSLDSRSEIWVNSTGDQMTEAKMEELSKLNVGAIMFSMHHYDREKFNNFLGRDDAWDNLTKGIALCHKYGIAPALNSCLPKDALYDEIFEKIMSFARDHEIALVQLIKPKPSGGWLSNNLDVFTESDLDYVKRKVHFYNNNSKYKSYPPISAQIIEEDKSMFGCTAGGSDRFYLNAKGDVQPCEFLNISYGNIKEEPFDEIYSRMRRDFIEAGDCWICEKYSCEINEIYQKENIKSLPLSKKLSREITQNWERGNLPEFYKKMKNIN